MTANLRRPEGYPVNHKRIQRLMQLMGLEAIYPKPRTSKPAPGHKIFPILCGLTITRPNQAWSTDITYIPMARGFMYLTAVIDWHSRYALAWQLSNTLDGQFCLDALRQALQQGTPDIFNTDQGSQFTAQVFTDTVLVAGVKVSIDGRGRALDNIFIERLWWSVKYGFIYLMSYATGSDLRRVARRTTSASTIANGLIRTWAIARRRRCTAHDLCAQAIEMWKTLRRLRVYHISTATAATTTIAEECYVYHLIFVDSVVLTKGSTLPLRPFYLVDSNWPHTLPAIWLDDMD